jgi:UDP-glucose 4-epimerase
MILVVGGAGYIGSHVCRALSKSGRLPICLDNFSTGHREFVKWGPTIEAELLDTASLTVKLQNVNVQAVIHLAAKIEVRESIERPLAYFENNVSGSLSLFEALKATHPNVPIIFSSTAAVYGEPEQVPIPESHRKKPINPYGTTKHLVEEILSDLWTHSQWPSLALRYFNVAGAAFEDGIGEAHEPESHLIPRLLMSVTDPEFKMQIYGADHPTPDGYCVRDYVHVADLAEAHVKALDYLMKNPGFDRMNIGYSKGFSVKEIIDAVGSVTGTPLGWTPEYAGRIQEIIRHAWEWHKIWNG